MKLILVDWRLIFIFFLKILKLEKFKGCIRRFTVNNVTQDLAKAGLHHSVGQCFPSVEKGTYFPGDAYAIFSKSF